MHGKLAQVNLIIFLKSIEMLRNKINLVRPCKQYFFTLQVKKMQK